MHKGRVRILMTGAGAPGGPGIIQCLQNDPRIELIVGDMDAHAAGRYLTDRFVLLSKASSATFAQDLIGLCGENEIDLIFPLVTKELFELSHSIAEFEANNIRVIVSPYEGLLIANDKIALYRHLMSSGISLPDFRVANNAAELTSAVRQLGYPDHPVVIKPGISNGSRGIRILDDSKDKFRLFFDEKPTTLFSTLEEVESLIAGEVIPPMLVSEYLPGEELTIDTIVSKGKVTLLLVRTRDRMNGGISVAGHFITDDAVSTYCKSIIGTMNLAGPIGLQVKRSRTGEYKVLEINPRIQGTSVAAKGLGINLPRIAVYDAMGWPYDIPKKTDGIGFVRYYSEAFYETKRIS